MTEPVSASPVLAFQDDAEHASLWSDAWHRLAANRLAVLGLTMIVGFITIALIGPLIAPYDYLSQDMAARNLPPSWMHWFGTDTLGRDVLSRTLGMLRHAGLWQAPAAQTQD